ncbi:hypothetical protein ACOMHN_032225 [Nucella lapillus]
MFLRKRRAHNDTRQRTHWGSVRQDENEKLRRSQPKQPPGMPGRRGRPPKNKQKLLKRTESSDGVTAEPSRGLIQAEQRCDYCQLSPLCNRKGLHEALLIC